MDKAMPIAISHQSKEGPAKILTVVDDDQVEEFDIEVSLLGTVYLKSFLPKDS